MGQAWYGPRADDWRRYVPYFLVSLSTLALGVVFGVLAVGILSVAERAQLVTTIQHFMHWGQHTSQWGQLFEPALIQNLKALGLLYLLGVSVAGIPLVLVLLFFRGFVVGFAGAVLAGAAPSVGVKGLIGTVVSQNLLIVPALAVAGTLALAFSWTLLSSRQRHATHLGEAFFAYTVWVVGLSGVMVVATLLEVYGADLVLHVLA